MGIIVNQSVKGNIYTYLGVALGFITTAILLPRIYSTAEIGLLNLLVAYSSMFATFGTLGFNGVTYRLFPFFRDEKRNHHGYLANILIVGLIGFLLSALLIMLLKPWIIESSIDKSSLFIDNFNYLIILVLFQIFFSLLDAYYSALLNSVTGTLLKEVLQKILIIISIGLYFTKLIDFSQFVFMYVICISLPTLFIVFNLIREKKFSLYTEFKFIDRKLLLSISAVSFFSILTGFSLIMIQRIDAIMIGSLVGLGASGIYFVCFNFGLMVSVPARPIIKIVNVVSAQAWKENDLKLISDIYHKSCMTLFIIGMLMFIGLWANIDNIFILLHKPEYEAGKWVIFFIGLSSLIDMVSGANGSILGTSKYYSIQWVFQVIMVALLVITNLLLIPGFGITGAAIGSAISLSALNIIRYLFLLYKFNLQPFDVRFIYVAIIGAASYFISIFVPPLPNYIVDIMVRSTLLVILFCLPVYFLKLSDDLNAKTNKILSKIGIKK